MERRLSHYVKALPTNGAAVAAVLYLIMYAVYSARQPSALSLLGITNLLNDSVVLALASAGLTIVTLAGEFDLSGIGVIALVNVVVASISQDAGWGASLAAAIAIGLAVGLANGVLVAYFGLQSLASTLGALIVCQGAALLVLDAPGGQVADEIADGLTADLFGAVPVAAVILVGACLLWLLFKRTRLGVAIYSIGADETSSRLSGINVRRTRLSALAAGGLMYALAGFMLSAETGTGDPRASNAFLLYMYASVAIGGTSLMGGRGGVFGSLVGAGILTVMQKMLFALGVADFYTNIFNGVIMIFAIFISNLSAVLSRPLGRTER